MITTEFTTDSGIVSGIYRCLEEVIADETSPAIDDIDWDEHFGKGKFVLVKDGSFVAGVIGFYRFPNDTWECHMNMLPGRRGAKADEAFHQAVALLRDTVPVDRIVGKIPKKHPNVIAFAKRIGAEILKVTDTDTYFEFKGLT